MKAVAIDLGLKGALAFYDSVHPTGSYWEPMPVVKGKACWRTVFERIAAYNPYVLIVEKLMAFKRPRARPGEYKGTSPDLAIGMGEQMGNINMLAVALNTVKLVWVTPTQWQKNTLVPGKPGTTKARSIAMATHLYPNIDLTHNGKYKNPHDGAADALCILDWGLRHIGDGQ